MKNGLRIGLALFVGLMFLLGLAQLAGAQEKPNPTPPPVKVVKRIRLQHISPELLRLLLLAQTTTSTPPEPHGTPGSN